MGDQDVLELADEWIRACGEVEPGEAWKVPGLVLITALAEEVRALRAERDRAARESNR